MRKLAIACCAAALLAGCASPPKKDYAKFAAASPRAILVVPVVNRSVDVTAPDYFLSTVPIPLAERGYYVFPVNLVKRLLEDDGLADAALVHSAEPARLAKLFGADSILYVTIERWDAQYLVIQTNVTVEFTYTMKSAESGEVLWAEKRSMTYQSGGGGGGGLAGLIAAAVDAAITKAAPNYMPLARAANEQALAYPGPGIPAGPYRPEHRKDLVAAAP